MATPTLRILATALLSLASATLSAQTVVTLLAGVEDGYALPTEPSSPSAAALATYDLLPGDVADFDEQVANSGVLHTFAGLPTGIVSGSLRFRVGGNPNVGAAGNEGDGILLTFADAVPDDLTSEVVWSRTFGPTTSNGVLFTNNDPGLLSASTWTGQSDDSITLDLAAMPLAGGGSLNLIPALNQNGFLDIFLGDDSRADFVELVVTTPEPATALLMLSGLLIAPGGLRNRAQRRR